MRLQGIAQGGHTLSASNSPFVDSRWLASQLKVSTHTLRRWVAEKRFPAPDVSVGRSLRWRLKSLIEHIPGLGDSSQAEGA